MSFYTDQPVEASFFKVNISSMFGEDGAFALSDVMRMLTIQTTVQALLYFNDPNCASFFTAEFVLLSMYVMLGVLVYWLVIRRLVKFV